LGIGLRGGTKIIRSAAFFLRRPFKAVYLCQNASYGNSIRDRGSQWELEIPVEIRESMGILDGTRLCIYQDEARIIAEIDVEAVTETVADE